ncbi:CDP-alcohol phosphatidyltransferase family protein [Consotaella salsifontis]|uniref:CDP-diacylglycerol--glycerol-3-phosphate 3-phosphatidyltransferase n=1 Tax=Consotaella salsifontis TaxID=1365950 RepID=A0A1T4P4H3_9HYPH|nr:CDP-alcohol phosphatidyltransferase family protein [Consotaella salsifontis]SJZ85818.1 cardiolipin synthase [Consotaella salsifontis]
MTIPNFISIARLLCVPAIVWSLIAGEWLLAFSLFVLSSLSDGIDGYIARRFDQQSQLGAYLDPIADKAMLGAVFVVLGIVGGLPAWLVIVVVSRDILIVAAVMLSFVMGLPMKVRPLLVSKATTAAQMASATLALAHPAFDFSTGAVFVGLIWLTALLTVLSAGAYLIDWLRHMATGEIPADKDQG